VETAVSFLIAEDDALVVRLVVRALSAHGETELVTTIAGARSVLEPLVRGGRRRCGAA